MKKDYSKLQGNRVPPERVKTMLGYAMVGLPHTYTGAFDNVGVSAVLDQSAPLNDPETCLFSQGDA